MLHRYSNIYNFHFTNFCNRSFGRRTTELATVIGTGGFIVLITVFVLFIIIRVVQLLCCKIKCC